MTWSKILLVLVVLTASTLAQYNTYEESDEEEDHEEGKSAVDYTKYFGGLGGSVGPASPTHVADDTAGFVQPLDFTGIFAGGNFGVDGLTGGSTQHVFKTPGVANVALPIYVGGFPHRSDQVPSNSTGFVNNNVNFPSLFDTSSSASESGFRPRDFIPRVQHQEESSREGFYSPEFSSLQRDVDREVDYQKKEEDSIEQARSASRRHPQSKEHDDDDDPVDFDSSEDESDEPPILDPNDRGPQKYLKQPYEIEKEERNKNINRKPEAPKTATNIQIRHFYHPLPETRSVQPKPKRPLPTLSEPQEDYRPQMKLKSRGFVDEIPFPHRRPPLNRSSPPKKNPSHSMSISQVYNTPSARSNTPTPRSHPRKSNGPKYSTGRSNFTPVSYQYYNPSYSAEPTQSRTVHPNKYSNEFKPSPRDPYFDSSQKPPIERKSFNPRSKPTGWESPLPQTEFATVIRHNHRQPIASASEKRSSCRKVQRKMDPNDFDRFKRQQMTCYICKNEEKGNTYEECSYESDPVGKSFFKGSKEAYSADTIIPNTQFGSRLRRNVGTSIEKSSDFKVYQKPLTRITRQHDYSDSQDEKGHGPENYRFGPEYFQDDDRDQDDVAPQIKQKQSNDDDEEYDEDDNEEETDTEKEYQPPGATDSDDCHKVKKNGLTCMVCENPKSGGSYEQCSYASDPDSDRYEYARQSTYGSKRTPVNDRYKRHSDRTERGKKPDKKKLPNKKRHYSHSNSKKEDQRNKEFRNGKLKRKKATMTNSNKRPIEYSESENKNRRLPTEEERPGVVGLDPFFYGSSGEPYNPDNYDDRGRKIKRKRERNSEDDDAAASSTEDDSEDADPTYEESFYRLFPELVGTDPYTGESLERRAKENKGDVEEEDDFRHPNIPYEDVEDEEESESKQKSKTVKPEFDYGVDLPDYYFDNDESKKDLEKALDDFTQKNRSECKKVMKDKMTCYQCLDEKGMQHEECMFVAASEPKSKHLAYHEVKEFRVTPKEKVNIDHQDLPLKESGPSSGLTETARPTQNLVFSAQPLKIDTQNQRRHHIHKDDSEVANSKRKRKIKGGVNKDELPGQATEVPIVMVTDNEGQPALTYDILKINPKDVFTHTVTPEDILISTNPLRRPKRKPQDVLTTVERRTSARRQRRKQEQENDEEEDDPPKENAVKSQVKEEPPNTRPNYHSVPPDPEGFDEREGPEGAYSHETEPVFDSVLKISLPKYMLTKSEHERIFDEVSRSG